MGISLKRLFTGDVFFSAGQSEEEEDTLLSYPAEWIVIPYPPTNQREASALPLPPLSLALMIMSELEMEGYARLATLSA